MRTGLPRPLEWQKRDRRTKRMRRTSAMTDGEHSNLLTGYPVVVELPVVWGEMDSYRHVNNAVYFRYFESARLEYFRRMDWFAYEEQTGIGPILAATQARFRRPVTYPDTIAIGARIVAIDEHRMTMEYLIVSQV